jgi:hypothetical protein
VLLMAPGERGREPIWSDVLLWFETIDAILRGLGHSLNNRALALGATIESLDPKRPVGKTIASGLSHEAERLTETLRQFRALPFAIDREPMPLLLRDVLASAIQLHRSHASVGDIPAYLEGAQDAPPVLVPESALLHATLVTLTALKGFAAPGGLVRVTCTGSADRAELSFRAEREPGDAPSSATAMAVISPMALAAALLGSSALEIEQVLTPSSATIVWILPSLKATRRMAREAAAVSVAG